MAEYIERRRASNACYEIFEETVRARQDMTAEEIRQLLLKFEKAINATPTADVVEVRHGQWEQFECGWRDDYWRCSVCDFEFTTLDGEHPQENGVNYCPNCGCRMDGGNE